VRLPLPLSRSLWSGRGVRGEGRTSNDIAPTLLILIQTQPSREPIAETIEFLQGDLMDFLTELWLPIVLSTVGVFIASAVLWMASPLHKKDFTTPPEEDGIRRIVREKNFAPGQYFIPWGGCGNMKDPAFLERMKEGPWLNMVVMSGTPNFGRSLIQWFIHVLVLTVLIAYAAGVMLPTHAPIEYLKVFQVVGAIAILAHAGSWAENTIWKGLPWRLSISRLFDGLVYGLLTAGVFAWLWPRVMMS
jgi:hypothetical protein